MEKKPKYAVVKQAILEKIKKRQWQVDEKLPSEEELASFHQVSTITVRKALAELAFEGYVNRIKGKGTFVSPPKIPEKGSNLIALILSAEDYHDASYMQIIKGAQKTVSDYGYSLIIEWSDESLEVEQEIIKKMLSRDVDGFLIYPFDPIQSKANYNMIAASGTPYVLIDRHNPDCPTYFAGSNNYEGAIQATKALLQRKHTKIKFASYHFFLSSEHERFDGYCSAMWQAGLPVTPDNLINDADYDNLAQEIRNHETTAIFCCNDKMAMKFIKQLTARNIRIPQDISIIGFDDWEDLQHTELSLSTVKQNFEQLGENAANLLINAITKKVRDNNVTLLTGVELIIRNSICENPYQ